VESEPCRLPSLAGTTPSRRFRQKPVVKEEERERSRGSERNWGRVGSSTVDAQKCTKLLAQAQSRSVLYEDTEYMTWPRTERVTLLVMITPPRKILPQSSRFAREVRANVRPNNAFSFSRAWRRGSESLLRVRYTRSYTPASYERPAAALTVPPHLGYDLRESKSASTSSSFFDNSAPPFLHPPYEASIPLQAANRRTTLPDSTCEAVLLKLDLELFRVCLCSSHIPFFHCSSSSPFANTAINSSR